MLTLTQFSRKIGRETRHFYALAKIVPLPKTLNIPKAGMSKFYDEEELREWHEKALAARKNNQ